MREVILSKKSTLADRSYLLCFIAVFVIISVGIQRPSSQAFEKQTFRSLIL